MTSGSDYLSSVLSRQVLTPDAMRELQQEREAIERVLRSSFGYGPRIYYAGSYGKDTMIAAYYDLDIVVYFPHTTQDTLKTLYWSVYRALENAKYHLQTKNVAIRLPYRGGFNVDVVPGRARDNTFEYASLYKTETGSWFQTSIKIHIDAVTKSGGRDVMKLLKLWAVQHGISVRSIALELLTIRALSGYNVTGLESRFLYTLAFIRDNITSVRLVDPANSNNIISDLIPGVTKTALYQQAYQATRESVPWSSVVW